MRRSPASLAGAALVAAGLLVPLGSAVAQVPTVPTILPESATDITLEPLSTDTQDPTDIAVASDGRVIWTEREGAVNVLVPGGTQVEAGRLPVSANLCDNCVVQDTPPLEEGGLHGLLLAKDFEESGRIYLYRSIPGSRNPDTAEGIFRLSTFVLGDDNVLDLDSEQVILENPAEWDHCCHYGGDLNYMPDGTIVMSVGDDTNPFESNGYAPIDERPGREAFNAQRTSGNPADRRGKVLRFMPDGSVPDGSQAGIEPNPHVGDPDYDPYVYAMGFRSDYRISVDPDTGTVYVGNVGPDAYTPDPTRGPYGYDEVDVIPPGGGTNHGWPHCIGPNEAYVDYDFATSTSGPNFSCAGMTPPAIYYPYLPSAVFPQLGNGSRTAMAGDVYKYEGDGALQLPARFQGKLLFLEWSRNYLMTVPVNADGTLATGRLARQDLAGLRHPHDTAIGPDGAVYLVEYGNAFWNSTNSRVSRLICTGCTPDPTDYGLASTALGGPAEHTGPGPGTTGGPATRWALISIGSLLLLGSVGLRRRRTLAA